MHYLFYYTSTSFNPTSNPHLFFGFEKKLFWIPISQYEHENAYRFQSRTVGLENSGHQDDTHRFDISIALYDFSGSLQAQFESCLCPEVISGLAQSRIIKTFQELMV